MREKGVALMIVVMVLAALAAIALPFSVSMSQHLRAMRAHSAETSARLAAEGALAHARAVLYRTQDSVEKESLLGGRRGRGPDYGPPWDTPEYDSIDEFETSPKKTLHRAALAELKEKGISFSDSRGTIWSARIEDEQGKVNILSASPQLLGSVIGATVLTQPVGGADATLYVEDASVFFSDGDPSTVDGELCIDNEVMPYLSADGGTIEVRRSAEGATRHGRGSLVYPREARDVAERAQKAAEGTEPPLRTLRSLKEFLKPRQFDAVERYLTVWSYRDSALGWIRKEEVKDKAFDSDATRVLVEDASNYGRGARARLCLNGKVQCVRRVRRTDVRPGKHDIIAFEDELGFINTASDEVTIELLQRHPVNVNTAPRKVLVALFLGLATKGDYVDAKEAEAMADYVLSLGAPIRGEAHLREVLEAASARGIISRPDAQAVVDNALGQSSHNLLYSTTTFCYKSHGNFTVEATGVVNTPAGVPLASHTLRETVSIPPTASGVYELLTQKDFDDAMRTGPGSRKVATWPNALSDGEHYEPDDTLTELDEFGDVRIQSAPMAAPYAGLPSPCKGEIEHFEKKKWNYHINPDGLDLTKGGGITMDAGAGFEKSGNNVKPGAFSMWFRPDLVEGRQYLFDLGQEPARNRVSLYYDSAEDEFVLRACGPETVPADAVAPEFHLPWDIEEGTWYHVGASWKGTLPWEASIRVDGRIKQGDDPYYLPAAKLAGDLNMTADSIGVDDASYFPQKGVVRIGDEIIEYDSKGGSSLDDCRRGQRYSFQSAHKRDEVVCVYGYSNPLAHDLYTGGASLAEDLSTSAGTKINDPSGIGVDKTDDEIPVTSTAGFQSSGFIRIAHDVLYYEKLGTTGDGRQCFEGCSIHKLQSNSGKTYTSGAGVTQVSIRIDQIGSYIRGGGNAFASIQPDAGPVEWIHIGSIESNDGKNYIVPQFKYDPDTNALYYAWGWRWQFGSSGYQRTHDQGEKVVPVVRMQWPRCGAYFPKSAQDTTWDELTVADSSGFEDARIRRAYARSWWMWDNEEETQGHWEHQFLVCLDQWVSRQYKSGNGGRLLKFPSGELPASLPAKVTVGSADDGSDAIFSVIDEVGFGTGAQSSAIVAPDSELNKGDMTTVAGPDIFSRFGTGAPGLPSNGAVWLAGELVHFGSKSSNSVKIRWYHDPNKDQYLEDYPKALYAPEKTLSCLTLDDCVRGALGTSDTDHGTGTKLIALDDYPLTTLTSGGGLGEDRATVQNAANFPQEGYLFLPQTSEIMGWTLLSGNTLQGCEFLRGCFGTAPVSHVSDELALAIPFRYWSRFLPMTDSPAWSYYQFSCTRRGAVWRSISWEEADYAGEGAPEGARPVFLVRFDGSPGWETEPANLPGSIWLFGGGGEHSFKAVEADQIEVRIGFSHLTNAFRKDGTSAVWKTTPMVKNVTVTYFMSPVVRERNELDSP